MCDLLLSPHMKILNKIIFLKKTRAHIAYYICIVFIYSTIQNKGANNIKRKSSRFERQVPGAQVPDDRCQVPGVEALGVRCQVPVVRCQVCRFQVSDVRCQVPAVRCQVPGSRCWVPGFRDTRYQVPRDHVSSFMDQMLCRNDKNFHIKNSLPPSGKYKRILRLNGNYRHLQTYFSPRSYFHYVNV